MSRKKAYRMVLILIIVRVIYSVIKYFGMQLLIRVIAYDNIVPVMQFSQIVYWILTLGIVIGIIMALTKGREILSVISLILVILQIGLDFGIMFFTQRIINSGIPAIFGALTLGEVLMYVSYISSGISFVINVVLIIFLSILYAKEPHRG
ncbi:hypothetical protein QBE53_11230 [Vallitaleaceae bacterium 9-2]